MTAKSTVITPGDPAPRKRDASAERPQGETIARLQRGILRLALAYHGQNQELDNKLKEFGTLIRSGRRHPDRQQLIDEIVDTIVSLDLKKPGTADDAPAGASERLNEFLELLDVPDTMQPEIERARRALTAARDRADALEQMRATAAMLSQNLLRSPDSCRDAAAIRMLLVELLERVPVSPVTVRMVSPIRHAIEKADSVPTFIECIDRIAELVGEVRAEVQAEVDELSRFLESVAQRLTDFDAFLYRSRDAQSACSADTLQLSESVTGEMQGMRDDALAAENLASLRALIDTRIDNIGAGLRTFVDAQSIRMAEADQAVQRVTEQLKSLETQTETLREDLEQQHARILIDPLTGVLNRTGYNETGAKQFARWKRYGGALSLAVIDLDLFKHVNDLYGHSAGDRVLSTVAQQLRDLVRESDILCRYGGEEFVLLLPETNARQGHQLLEKLRAHIETCPFRHKDTPVRITLSCGIAQFRDSDTLSDVFERADKAMYLAKAGGRNRVCSEADNVTIAMRDSA